MAIPYKYATPEELLLEATRNALIAQSRNAGIYRDQSKGKNRFQRKKLSKVANTVKAFNSISMNNLWKQDELLVNIPIIGETDSYTVSVKMNGVVEEIVKNLKNNRGIFEFKIVVQAVTKVFNTGDVYIKCTCDDYKYRFKHWNILNKVDTEGTEKDPGPGKGIRNPKDSKGRGCKHVLLVLANMDWVMKVSSVIHNYVNYAAQKLQKPFLNVIFPKLYGVPASAAEESNIVENEEDLELDSSANLIDIINKWARTKGLKQNRGKPVPEPPEKEEKKPTARPEKKDEKSEENSEETKK